MDKLVIGGELPKNEALVTKTYWESEDCKYRISKGARGFMINGLIDFYVINGSKEYDHIMFLLNKNKDNPKVFSESEIRDYLDIIAIANLKPHEILNLIDDIKLKNFNKGIEVAQKQMRQALGLIK